MRSRALSLSCVLGVAACSSGNFQVAPSGDGGGGGDTAVDPCAPVDGVSKFCVTVKAVASHPPYDSSSGFTALGIDGSGVLKVDLYNEDPGDPSRSTTLAPVATITYPESGELVIDKDLPATFSDSAPAGNYWFVTRFEDNATVARDGLSNVPGDFVHVPTFDASGKTIWPTVTLSKGTTQPIVIDALKPVRRVDATVQVNTVLHTIAKTNPTIHGDGPMYFFLYDGTLAGTGPDAPTVLDAQLGFPRCVQLQPGGLAPEVPVSFGTTVDGSHKLLALLFDYEYPKTGTLLTKGTLYTATVDGGATGERIPTVNPGSTAWSSAVAVRLVADDAYPAAGTPPVDKLVCK